MMESTMFTAIFHLVSRVRILGTMRDGSLLIDNLASFKCFTYRLVKKNINNLSKSGLKKTPLFGQTAQNFV